jgi:hypothetical protein
LFEQALVLKAGDKPDWAEVGLLAETLFFYGSVQLLLNSSSLTAFSKAIPADSFIELLDREGVKVSYLRPTFAVATNGSPPLHDFGAFTFHSEGVGKKPIDHREEIQITLERVHGKSAEVRKFAQRVADRTKLHRFSGVPEKEKTIADLARIDVKDARFVRAAVASVLHHLVPEFTLSKKFQFRLVHIGGQLAVDTDLDFEFINSIYHQRVSIQHSSINAAYLLSHILDARADSFFAAYYMAEPVTSPIFSDLIKLKHFEFLQRCEVSRDQQEQFTDVVVPDFPSIRETINGGHRTFREFLALLDQAGKFKRWIQTANPDASLLQSYHRAATEATWADKLPTKSVRFAVATGLGLAAEALAPSGVGISLGLSAGAADSLFMDRLIKGWRPNQFIAGPFANFLRPPPMNRNEPSPHR